MSETRYMISDTAKKVDVEAHVLRYWEEELEIGISRTELGHRYYTEEDIKLFQKIKELKERGLQLKAIKVLIPELEKRKPEKEDRLPVIQKEKEETCLCRCVRNGKKSGSAVWMRQFAPIRKTVRWWRRQRSRMRIRRDGSAFFKAFGKKRGCPGI